MLPLILPVPGRSGPITRSFCSLPHSRCWALDLAVLAICAIEYYCGDGARCASLILILPPSIRSAPFLPFQRSPTEIFPCVIFSKISNRLEVQNETSFVLATISSLSKAELRTRVRISMYLSIVSRGLRVVVAVTAVEDGVSAYAVYMDIQHPAEQA